MIQTYRTLELSGKVYAGIQRVKCDVWYGMEEIETFPRKGSLLMKGEYNYTSSKTGCRLYLNLLFFSLDRPFLRKPKVPSGKCK